VNCNIHVYSLRDGSGSGSGQIPTGFGSCGFGFRDGFSLTVFGFDFEFGIGFGFGFGFSPVDIQWISKINHLELKLIFYNMLIITCLLILLNLIYTCEYGYIYPRVSGIHSGFGYPFGFRVSAGLVLVMDFHPNRFSVRVRFSILGFGFRCTETPPDPNPTRCYPYIHYNICNIQMKHMQHLDETIKTFGTHTCNMLLKIAEIFETYTCNICV
jgi:hypothetical protein